MRQPNFSITAKGNNQGGFTLLEIIIVITLIAVLYSVALPNLSLKTGSEAATKLGAFSRDIRSAYDMAVLHGRPYRIVINFVSGDYWLETTDRRDFFLGDEKLHRDLTEEEEKEAIEAFEEDFKVYEDLAGQEIEDPENERTIRPASPVVMAKDKLSPTKWTIVEDREWGVRTLGPYMLIQDMQAEHHSTKQTADELEEKARGMLYFFPSGYVERAVIHIAMRKGDTGIDESQPPYTVTTNPYVGTANVVSGYEEIDILNYAPDT